MWLVCVGTWVAAVDTQEQMDCPVWSATAKIEKIQIIKYCGNSMTKMSSI